MEKGQSGQALTGPRLGRMPKAEPETRKLGRLGEDMALEYLKKKNYRIIDTGFRIHRGEIDIIARDGGTLVFIEVKTRNSAAFGRPEESVTPAKQRQVRRLAQGYLMSRGLGDADCRFDVIAVRRADDGGYEIEHFRNAF